ncbi:MAG: ADP-ribosylglycohydrolase family protein [Clostridia bacterium]|nr:ADP-ribosylglycohydrolase family protein [Clostridia bacterium]
MRNIKSIAALLLVFILIFACACGTSDPGTSPDIGQSSAESGQLSVDAGQSSAESGDKSVPDGESNAEPASEPETPSEDEPVSEDGSASPSGETSEGGNAGPAVKAMTEEEIRDRVEGSWAAQMAGVTWGAPTEFQYQGGIIPENAVPVWKPEMINDAFGQDDLYVEIPFLEAMADNGVSCKLQKLADAFRDTTFGLDHANKQGRANLRAGIKAPDSGSYKYNYHCDDIDWQIEADFLGNLYPGMPEEAAKRAFEIGHIMNYGDGVYGGVYIAVMHAAAYTADSVYEIAEAGRKAIPEGTKFRKVLDEVNDCYKAGKTWEQCWKKIQDDWAKGARCVAWKGLAANIDAKINAAYVHMGLLWGEGDFEKTMLISMRCGQDSDCNPSSSAGVLGTFYGLKKLPDKFVSALNRNTVFSCTDESFKSCVDKSMKLISEVFRAKNVETKDGARLIPVAKPENFPKDGLVPFEQWPSDAVNAYLAAEPGTRGEVRVTTAFALPEGYQGEPSQSLDMGDGSVFQFVVGSYRYEKDGVYEIKYTVKAGDKKSTATVKVEVTGAGYDSRGFESKPSCSTKSPTGSGSKDISVITDGFATGNPLPNVEQYDTYTGAHSESEWFALSFDRSVHVTAVIFTEGLHFGNGGWFENPPSVQILKDGKWKDVSASCDPKYGGNEPNTTFTFKLSKADWCDGVRVIGKPGGTATFVSCAELDVRFDDVKDPAPPQDKDPVQDAVIIAAVTEPRGTGCKDIEIIRDGYLPSSSDNYMNVSYDTFAYDGADHEEFVGYLFRSSQTVKSVTFTEGAHFNDGGYFKDGSIRLETLVGGEWKTAETTLDKAYPVGNAEAAFGPDYESYTFTLKSPASCDGVRVIGSAGGSMHFISVSELSVEFKK